MWLFLWLPALIYGLGQRAIETLELGMTTWFSCVCWKGGPWEHIRVGFGCSVGEVLTKQRKYQSPLCSMLAIIEVGDQLFELFSVVRMFCGRGVDQPKKISITSVSIEVGRLVVWTFQLNCEDTKFTMAALSEVSSETREMEELFAIDVNIRVHRNTCLNVSL